MTTIRVAESKDAAAIAHVHVQSWVTTYEGIIPQAYLDALDERERAVLWQDWLTRDISVFVAEEEGRVVGFAGGGPIREVLQDYDSELYTLYLLKEAQGNGIGKSLLERLADALVQRGHRKMLVWVLEQNPAVHFYEKTGAQVITSRNVEIAGIQLPEIALGWPDLRAVG